RGASGCQFDEPPGRRGGIDGPVVVVDQSSQPEPGRTPQVDVADGLVAEHPANDECRIELGKALTGLVDVEDVAQTALPESEPVLAAILVKLVGRHRKG